MWMLEVVHKRGNGQSMWHYEGHDDEAEDLANNLGLLA
jgi:hypothetical protein